MIKKPNVKYANDRFNWLNRLNNRKRLGELNIVAASKKNKFSNFYHNTGVWREWKPYCDFFCKLPELVFIKSKIYNENPIRLSFKKQNCSTSLFFINKFTK